MEGALASSADLEFQGKLDKLTLGLETRRRETETTEIEKKNR